MNARLRLGNPFRHPAQVVVAGFFGAIVVSTAGLLLPISTSEPGSTDLVTALFTATSAICVTGLAVVDTASYWSPFGKALLLLMIQLGGIGIMTLATVVTLAIARGIGLRQRLLAQAETGALALGDVRALLRSVINVTLAAEAIGAVVLTMRFWWTYDESFLESVWLGVFHSVSAWNNAGFALYRDSLVGFDDDPFVLVPIALAVIVGGLGFPVLIDMKALGRKVERYTLHTKLTLAMSAWMLGGGTVLLLFFEWANPHTLGPLDVPGKLLSGWFSAVMPRTAGFNSIDIASLRTESVLLHLLLMFVGAGSASTAGGIKVTTFAVIALMVWAEVRGSDDTIAFRRRIPLGAQRQAVSVTAIALVSVFFAMFALAASSPFALTDTLFEGFSAFGTVGLSTGITPGLPTVSKLLVVALMFIGRTGPLTVGAALLLHRSERLYRYPEERPMIG